MRLYNWEDLGLGTIEELSEVWGIPVEQLKEEECIPFEEELLSDKEQQKVINIFLQLGKEWDNMLKIAEENKKRCNGDFGDLGEIS